MNRKDEGVARVRLLTQLGRLRLVLRIRRLVYRDLAGPRDVGLMLRSTVPAAVARGPAPRLQRKLPVRGIDTRDLSEEGEPRTVSEQSANLLDGGPFIEGAT